MKDKQDADKHRQMMDLEAKLAARKNKKLKEEQKDLLEKELELLADPEKIDAAEVAGVQASLAVRQELEAARLAQAFAEQESADLQSSAHEIEAKKNADIANAELEFQQTLA